MNSNDDQLRYPTGKFSAKDSYTAEERNAFIRQIATLPSRVEDVTKGFSEKQWNTPYREGGWTAKQVVHHLADSHMNAYIRLKWTLTEDSPVIKAYDEKLWAETPEVTLDPMLSINLLKSLHAKWTALLENLPVETLNKYFIHPDNKKQNSIERLMALYCWHGDHHLGHLKIIRAFA
jgi:hypothetical protein